MSHLYQYYKTGKISQFRNDNLDDIITVQHTDIIMSDGSWFEKFALIDVPGDMGLIRCLSLSSE